MAGVSVVCAPVVRTARHFQLFGRSCVINISRPVSKGSSDGPPLPPKPKRPPNAFIKFANQNLNSIRAENPGLTITQRMTVAGQKWKLLSDEEKEQYKPTSADMIRYNEEVAAWESELTDDEKTAIQQTKERRKVVIAKLRLKKRLKELEKPAVPARTGFIYYVKSKQIERGDAPITVHMKDVAQQWRKLTEEDKQPFEQQAKDARDQYKVELQKWEDKMLEEGNFDVVRRTSLPKGIDKKTRKPKKQPKTRKASKPKAKKRAKPKKTTKAKKKKAATKSKTKKTKTKTSRAKKKTEEEDPSWMRDE